MLRFKVWVMLSLPARTALALAAGVSLLAVAPSARPAENLKLAWTNNMLTISGANLPGKSIEVWDLEAFCRIGSTHRGWHRTGIPHKADRVLAGRNGDS